MARQFEPARCERQAAERGFTLAEVLIAIAIVLLLTLITIPNLPGTRMQANENSAIASLRAIHEAEVKYESTYPTQGFACSLTQMGGRPGHGAPSPAEAQVLPTDLAHGEKSGYRFAITHCVTTATGGSEQPTDFVATAVPQTLGKTGHRGFCIDRQGELRADPTGGSNCTQSIE